MQRDPPRLGKTPQAFFNQKVVRLGEVQLS